MGFFDATLAVLIIPACAAALLAVLPGYRITARINVVATLLTFIAALSLFFNRPPPGRYLLVDDLNNVFIVLTTFVGFTTSVFSASYIGHELDIGRLTPRFLRFYHAMYQVLMFAMNLALTANNIGVMCVAKTRQKEVGFQVMVGAPHKLEASLQVGAVGAILAFGCAAPTACYEIYAAWKEGDHELAHLKQERIAASAQRVAGELGIPGIKHAMDLNGYYGGAARLPFLPLTAESKSEVERLMADIRN